MRYKAAPKLTAITATKKIFLGVGAGKVGQPVDGGGSTELSQSLHFLKKHFSGSLHTLLEIFQLTLKNTNPQKNLSIVVFCDPNQALEYEYLNSICIGESHNEVFNKKRGLVGYEICFHYTTCL